MLPLSRIPDHRLDISSESMREEQQIDMGKHQKPRKVQSEETGGDGSQEVMESTSHDDGPGGGRNSARNDPA